MTKHPNYPNDNQNIKGREFVGNVITVGALTPYFGEDLVAVFSNYEKKMLMYLPLVTIYIPLCRKMNTSFKVGHPWPHLWFPDWRHLSVPTIPN